MEELHAGKNTPLEPIKTSPNELLRKPRGRDWKWVRTVVKSRCARWLYAELSALDGMWDIYLGLSPQAGM